VLNDIEAITRSADDPEAFTAIIDRHGQATYAFLARRAGYQAADGIRWTAPSAGREGEASVPVISQLKAS
jgi:hypothetical protein